MIRPCQLRPLGRGQDFVVFREIDMKHASQAQFGRPREAVRMTSAEGPDKWELLQALTEAAEHYDLSHRTLGVLKALLTFHPDRPVPVDRSTIVFASNRALSERLSGMPESTLRRHLSALIRSGIVSRQDSPNKKRYARRIGGDVALAFGFDLAPLARMHAELQVRAKEAREHHAYLQVLRARLMTLRDQLLSFEGQGALTDEVALLLRRRPQERALSDAIETIKTHVDKLTTGTPATDKVSSTDSQNERHIQNSDKYDFDSERPSQPKTGRDISSFTLNDVLTRCTAFSSYFPEKVRGWLDLHNIANRLSLMMGIDQPVFDAARRTMGQERATVVILCMLERMTMIRKAGAYLRALTKKAAAGQFQVFGMLKALESREIVS